MTASQQPNPWINRSVGDRNRYRITSRLGGGGMGDVFLALDTLLGQQVALKLLKERLLSESDLRQRFEREVLVCAAIQSENVVQVKDYGVTSDGYPFFVMEYLRGQTLGQLLNKENRLTVERAVGIISQVCDGLQTAHSGVVMSHEGAISGERIQLVHRDLKPENIFLINTSLGELVKILDFGIAKTFGDQTPSTHTGLFMGTFQYAAPEQLEARKDLDRRADIYSLGIILYEMLSGTDPFGCSLDGSASGGLCWLRAHTSEHPRMLRLQPGCEHLPLKLEAVVMQCLRKAPSGRYNTVADLNQALQAATGITVDSRTMVRSLASAAKTMPLAAINVSDAAETITLGNADLQKAAADHQTVNVKADSPPQFSQYESSIGFLQAELAPILLKYIGPIAPIVVRQSIQQASSFFELVEILVKQVPATEQSKFRAATQGLLGKVSPETIKSVQTVIVPVTAVEHSAQSAPVPQSFVDRCERELADIIGPMAKLLIQRILPLKPTQTQLIEMLAQQISNPTHAARFRQRLQ